MIRDKKILLTGGSRGLGRAIGVHFAGLGARVAFTYSRDEAGANATVAAAAQAHATTMSAHRVSVTDAPAMEALVRGLEKEWGGIDVLVNNASISHNLPLALLEVDELAAALDVNVRGAFIAAKSVLRGMIRRKSGVVLNIGSLAGSRMIDAPVDYCTTKAAMVGLTMSMAKEVARHGIRVNCLAPGLLEDGMGRDLPEHRLRDYLAHTALGRLGTLDEVARLAAFMVSDQNTYMNGETVIIDGGL